MLLNSSLNLRYPYRSIPPPHPCSVVAKTETFLGFPVYDAGRQVMPVRPEREGGPAGPAVIYSLQGTGPAVTSAAQVTAVMAYKVSTKYPGILLTSDIF